MAKYNTIFTIQSTLSDDEIRPSPAKKKCVDSDRGSTGTFKMHIAGPPTFKGLPFHPRPRVDEMVYLGSTDQEILTYWERPDTRQDIIDAVPLDQAMCGVWDPDSDSRTPTARYPEFSEPPYFPVNDEDLKEFPHHSVGRIFYFYPTKRLRNNKIFFSSTAFYIGNSKLLTAAHTFDTDYVKNHEGVFVPAMIDKEDVGGRNYGHYAVHLERHKCHPRYTKGQRKSAFDICTIRVGDGHRSDNKTTVNIDRVGIQPITPHKEHLSYNGRTTWRAIGYPKSGKMTSVKGNYVRSKSSREEIAMDKKCSPGMSGGPWITFNFNDREILTNGCSSVIDGGKDTGDICSYSPRFDEELFTSLESGGACTIHPASPTSTRSTTSTCDLQ